MSDGKTYSEQELTDLLDRIFTGAGFSPDQAGAIARVIAAGERDGCKSHGVYRVEGVLRTLKIGKVAPDAEPVVTQDDSAIVRVDAKGGFSSLAFEMGAPVLVERARALGLAAMAVNDVVHFSALWPEVEVLAGQGLAALAMCPTYAAVAPFGGSAPLLGTNPFAFGWPRADAPPYVFDFATSVAARGEIELHRRAGKPLPDGWAIDTDGQPTTDPNAALAGAMLPFGGHKGSAISTMVELLAGPLIGDFTSVETLAALGTLTAAPRHGELIIALDPQRLSGGRIDPLRSAEAIFTGIEAQGARLPSTRRRAARDKAASEGIHLSGDEIAQLERLRERGLDAVT